MALGSTLTRYAIGAVLCASLGVSLARVARADEPPGEAAEKYARELFENADLAMRNTPPDYDAACEGFRKAYEIAHGLGALKKQAVCEEARGKLATALALWKQAVGLPQPDDRKAEAEKQVTNLEAKVGRLRVEAPRPGVAVTVDGAPWVVGDARPIDAGAHRVVFEGKDRDGRPSATTVDVTVTNGATATAREPEQGSVPPPQDPGPPPPDRAGAKGGMRVGGFVAAGLGAAGFITFGVTSALVLVTKSDLKDACTQHETEPFSGCNADAPGIVSKGNALNVVNAVSLGVGAVAVAVAVPLLVVGYKKTEPSTTAVVAPWIDGHSGGVIVIGGFQ